jgi:hypothetical protein
MKNTIGILLLFFQAYCQAQLSHKTEPSQLLFMENKGQVANQDGTARPDVLFSSNSGGARLYFTSNSIYYQFAKASTKSLHTAKDMKEHLPEKVNYATHRYTFRLEGSNPHPVIIKDAETPYTENFYLAHCPQGVTGVKSYRKIVYKDVYPGIDWVLYSKGQFFEYDFIVHPGANPAAIRFTISGADATTILPQGQLKVATRLGTVTEKKPVSFDSKGSSIPTNFIQHADKSFGFEGKFPSNEKVVIDPEVVWAFTGTGSGWDEPVSIAADTYGNAFEFGRTTSTSGISQNGFQENLEGSQDTYLRKLDGNGNLLWATYYGGASDEYCLYNSVATDSEGNVYITFSTVDNGLAYLGHQMQYGGSVDVMLVKFNPNGGRLWATYCDGITQGMSPMCTVSPDNSVYVVSDIYGTENTLSPDLQQYIGYSDVMISKYTAQGQRLWARAYGGESNDNSNSLATDSGNNLIIGGVTYSATFIDSQNPGTPHELYTADQPWDGFYAKINPQGATVWSRYRREAAYSIAIDASNNIYICGNSGSFNVLGMRQQIIEKYGPNGLESSAWQSYGTITSHDNPHLLIANNALYVYTPGGITDSNYQIPGVGTFYTLPGNEDSYLNPAVMYKLSLTGQPIWGWSNVAGTRFIASGIDGNFFATGSFLDQGIVKSVTIKIHDAMCPTALPVVYSQTFCPGTTASALTASGTMLKWYNSTGDLIDPLSELQAGAYYVSQTLNGCESEKKVFYVSLYQPTAAPVAASPQNKCGYNNLSNLLITGSNVKWYANATGGSPLPLGTQLQTGTYYASQTLNGCESPRTAVVVTVTVTPIPPALSFYSCTPATLADVPVNSSNPKYYTSETGGNSLPLTTAINNNIQYWISQTIDGCESQRRPVTIKSYNLQTPTAAPNQVFCQGKTLADVVTSPAAIKRYYLTATGGTAIPGTTPVFNGTVYISQTSPAASNCETGRVAVSLTVTPTPQAPIAPVTQSFCLGARVSELAITGTGVKWYFWGDFQPLDAYLQSGTYLATQTLNGCPSSYATVQVTVTNPPNPTVQGGTFTSCPGATVASLTATGTNLKWYTSATATTPLAPTDLLASGTYYVSQTINGCESQRASKAVTITNVSLPQAPASQTFCGGAKVSNLSATGQNKKWYMSPSGGSALAITDLLQSGTYYVSQTVNNCESFRVPVTVTVNMVAPPAGDTLQIIQAAPGVQPTLAALQVSGTSVSWYASVTNAQNNINGLLPSTPLTSGNTYYATRTENGCVSPVFAVTVTIVLGNDDFKTQDFSYFPNPVSGSLTIKAPVNLSVIKLYNTLGQQVLQAKPDAIETSIDFSGLAAGVYIIDAAAGTMTIRFRVIKN